MHWKNGRSVVDLLQFRAWDKVAKVMIYHIEQTYDGLGYFKENENIEDYVSDISFGCFSDWLENEQFVIMQSTGLFDKNGVEVFEGDVVEIIYDYEPFIGVVVYDLGETDFKATNGNEDYGNNFQYLTVGESIKVIGNVYQHPDLLERGE